MRTIKAGLFAHHDSRGGGFVFEADSKEDALAKYADHWMQWEEEIGENTAAELFGMAQDDFEAFVEIEIQDEPGKSSDLLYDDEGPFLWTTGDKEEGWEHCENSRYRIAHNRPGPGWNTAEWLGEDAFGAGFYEAER